MARYVAPDRHERSQTFSRKVDAERFLAGQETRKARGEWLDPNLGRLPFDAWAEQWLQTTTHLRPSSRSRTEGILRRHLLPRFGPQALAAITTVAVRALVSDLTTAGAAPATVRKVYSVLSSILRAAEEAGCIARSPCVGVKIAAPRGAEMRFLSPEQIAALADALPTRYRSLVLLGAYGGLRFGELAGLRVERVDFLRSRLTVEETIVEVSGRLHRGPTKTGPARMVTLPRLVTESLAEHLARFGAGEYGLLFSAPEGGPLRRHSFRSRTWVPAVAAAKLEPLRFHDLRHTAAALAIGIGAHPKAIQERLGHASITTTLDRYGHLFPALDEELAGRLDALGRDAGVAATGRRRDGDGTNTAASAVDRSESGR